MELNFDSVMLTDAEAEHLPELIAQRARLICDRGRALCFFTEQLDKLRDDHSPESGPARAALWDARVAAIGNLDDDIATLDAMISGGVPFNSFAKRAPAPAHSPPADDPPADDTETPPE